MASTQTRGVAPSGRPSYVWEAPEKPVSIHLLFDVMDRMHPEIMRGLGALKRRGAEVGGILLGRSKVDPESLRRVIIEDFEAVPTEYLTGPSYNLSENDLVALETALARRSSQASDGLTVVGFYRSHTRDGLFMDDADLALARRYFSDPAHVFLLIKPFASRPSIGGFFFWEKGVIHRESTYLQFPFDRSQLGGGEARPIPAARREPDREQPVPPYTPEAAPRPDTAILPPGGEPWSSGSRLSILAAPPDAPASTESPSRLWLFIPGLLAIAGAVGFFAYRNADTARAPAAPVVETALPLKLSVSERQHQLDVTWDRNAPVVMRARRGVLSITDGVNKRDLELNGVQLRTGRVLYSRLSPDVALRLEVYTDSPEPVTESIRIVSTDAARPAPERPPLAADTANPDDPPREITSLPPRPAPKPSARRPAVVKRAPPAAQPEGPPEVELQRPARRR